MPSQPADLVVYVDVDDTLVRQTGSKRIPMTAVVDHVRHLHRAGATLFCWSAGGGDYARAAARELGIEALFTGFLPKPHVLLDDQPPSEWPNCIVAVPAGLASATIDGHLAALAQRERGVAGERSPVGAASRQALAREAVDVDAALVSLRRAGASPIDAIRALHDGRGMSLSAAKAALASAPVWAEFQAAADALHDALLATFAEDSAPRGGEWAFRSETLAAARGVRITCTRGGVAVGADEVIAAWRDEPRFCAAWNAQLAAVPFAAFRWELPALTAATVARPFECVVLDSPELARAPDPTPFAKWFARERAAEVVEFGNLGGDAILIAPRPLGEPAAYVHLGVFVRQAPPAQRAALWAAVGAAMHRRLGKRPVWLNTAGAGVAWLHVRLDDRPKYYGYVAYRG